jgi:GNAT superfamily N-acetyltransferase
METKIIKGDDNLVYKYIAPYAMSQAILREFDGYPIITDKSFTWFILFKGRKIIAFSAIRKRTNSVDFTSAYVLPEYRNQDIHENMIKMRLDWCRENSVKKIKVDCNAVSLPKYLNVGFTVFKEFNKWHKLELDL